MSFWKKKRVYLDFAAGVKGNPSSPHEEGRNARKRLEAARISIARELQVKADDVLFTSGATEANALAIHGLTKLGSHVLYLPSAHASIIENVKMLEGKGVATEALVITNGQVDIALLKKMLRSETTLVTMEAVCGETGTIWNTREVATELRRAGVGRAYLHVDASQAVLSENISRAHFDADLLTLDGGKLGVRGTGVLVAHRTIPLTPLYGGGGQERGLRSGTENVEAAEQFSGALQAAGKEREAFSLRALRAREQLLSRISSIPGLLVNAGARSVPHILNLSLPGRDTDYLVALLDHAGFAVSTRSACETGGASSRAVFALTGDVARATSTLRISWAPATTDADLVGFATALSEAVHFLDTTGRAIL